MVWCFFFFGFFFFFFYISLSVFPSWSFTTKLCFRGKIKYFCLRKPFKLWNDCCHWHTEPPSVHTHTHITLPWFWMDRWLRREGGQKYIISWKEWGPLGFCQSGPSLHQDWKRAGRECWWCSCLGGRWGVGCGVANMATPHCNLSQKGANLSNN